MKKLKEDKEREILEAAVKVFARHGFHGAKMAGIAEEAGVSAGTLYNYFTDKEDMFDRVFAVFCREVSQGIAQLGSRSDFSCLEKLDGAVDLVFDLLGPHPDLIKVFANEFEPRIKSGDPSFMADYLRFKEIFVSLIERGGREKCFNANIPPDVASEFIMGGVKRIIYAMALEPKRYRLNTMRQNVKLMIRRGIVLYEE
ncbi:MAG: TetR/AcrR family transcriptional regulator [Desulfobacterales bacterium]|nr:TetR/AcrR family transcriptional regulator [Desulfobacterales bacterium]